MYLVWIWELQSMWLSAESWNPIFICKMHLQQQLLSSGIVILSQEWVIVRWQLCKGQEISETIFIHQILFVAALQMFTGIYRDSAGKSECEDFKFMRIACIPAIPVILKSPHSDFHVNNVGILTLQGYYGDIPR